MLYTKLSLFYLFYFSLLGVMAPYLGLYLEHQGFSLFEIAELTSLLMVTKIIAPNVWGVVADKTQNRLRLVRLGALLTLLSFVCFVLSDSFWQYAFAIVLYSFFWNAILPQFEVITLFNLAEQKDRYSRIRSWGSVGFILSVVFAGWLFERYSVAHFSWIMVFLIAAIWLSSRFSFSEPKVCIKNSGSLIGFKSQLASRAILLFFIASFLLQLSHGVYYTYFSIFLDSIGYSKTNIGLLWSLGVVAEIVLFLVMHKWFRAHSIKTIMIVALLFTSLRWILIAEFANNLWVLLFAQCLHAFSFGAMHAASIHFVHDNFSENNQGRAQALYSSAGFGAGGAAGAFLSGILVTKYGYSMSFIVSALIAFLAAIVIGLQSVKKNQF